MSDADTLRRAAALMRERAKAASAGPWEADGTEIYVGSYDDPHGNRGWVAESCNLDIPDGGASDAAHIASWHPGLALAVALWLEAEADMIDGYDGRSLFALNVATTYLKDPA